MGSGREVSGGAGVPPSSPSPWCGASQPWGLHAVALLPRDRRGAKGSLRPVSLSAPAEALARAGQPHPGPGASGAQQDCLHPRGASPPPRAPLTQCPRHAPKIEPAGQASQKLCRRGRPLSAKGRRGSCAPRSHAPGRLPSPPGRCRIWVEQLFLTGALPCALQGARLLRT